MGSTDICRIKYTINDGACRHRTTESGTLKKQILLDALRTPEVKAEIAKQVVAVIKQKESKERANSKQAAKREKR